MTREIRSTGYRRPTLETRADGERQIIGYAAVFYREGDPATEYRIFSDLIERVLPGAFDRAMSEGDDALGLWNHDRNHVLGRRSAGTVELAVDDTGLRYGIRESKRSDFQDLVVALERGDVSRSSFGFHVFGGSRGGSHRFVEEVRDGEIVEIRELLDVELTDVGPVAEAAYDATTAGMRSDGELGELRKAREAWREERRQSERRLMVPPPLPLDLLGL